MLKRYAHKDENGAVTVEATIALSVFIFAIFIILSIVNICFIQAKIGTALASSTKEMSQYSYLYYKFSLDKKEAALHEKTAEARETATNTVDSIGSLMGSLSQGEESLNNGDVEGLMNAVGDGYSEFSSIVTEFGDELKDPKAFITGMAWLAGEELIGKAKGLLGGLICRSFMEKNLVEYKGDNADRFLRSYKVKNGLNGLDFSGSSLMEFGVSDEIQMVVTYEIVVVKLLNFDFTFTIRQCARTSAWGNGISQMRNLGNQPSDSEEEEEEEGSVWDLGNFDRGRQIHDMERALFVPPTYGASGNGYDGYNQAENRFIAIETMYGATYNVASGVKSKLRNEFNSLVSSVSRVGDPVTVMGGDGSNTTVAAGSGDKKYTIILVVPENADVDMIKKAAREFESQKRAEGYELTIEVKPAYGSPTEKTDETEQGE